MKFIPSFATAALTLSASALSAQMVTYTIDGTITSVTHANSKSGLGADFTKNSSFELTFTGSANTSPSLDLPGLGLYSFDLVSGQITVGTNSFAFDQSSLGLVQDFGATLLTFNGIEQNPEFTVTASLGSFADLYPAGAFPTTFPLLSEFNLSKSFTLQEFSQLRGNFEAFGKITSIDVTTASPVPEPSTYSLAAAGLLGVGAILRRRRRAA